MKFEKAVRQNASLIIGLVSPSGGGKTYTAMELATGMSGGKRFAVIDTENRRSTHYADQFAFDVLDLQAPYRPSVYEEAIVAADDAGYPVIVIDSMSHEYAGHGGLLDWHDEEVERLSKGDAGKRDRVGVLAWATPKRAHKTMVETMLKTRAHLILCLRAEEKVEIVKDDKGRMAVVPKKSMAGLDGWVPLTERTLPYELTASFLMLPSAPGVPMPIKLQAQHRKMFPPGKPITRESGMLLSSWASGSQEQSPAPSSSPQPPVSSPGKQDETTEAGVPIYISVDQVLHIEDLLDTHKIPLKKFLATAKVDGVSTLTTDRYDGALSWIDKQIDPRG